MAGLTSLQKDEVFLNLVLEYVPETVFKASKHYSKMKQPMPWPQVKLYMYQVGVVAGLPPHHHLRRSRGERGTTNECSADALPGSPVSRIHPLCRYMPPRYQTPKPAPRSCFRYPQTVRLWFGQDLSRGRTECFVHLFEVL